MEITTLSNLVSLAIEITGFNLEAADANLNEETFNLTIKEIFNKISILEKWQREDDLVEEEESEDEEEESGDEDGDCEEGGSEEGNIEGDSEKGDSEKGDSENEVGEEGDGEVVMDGHEGGDGGNDEQEDEEKEDEVLNFYYGELILK